MEEDLSTNIVADDALIADLSERTAAAFTQYRRVFLTWGIIALVESVLFFIYDLIRHAELNYTNQHQNLNLPHIEPNQFPALLCVIGFPLMVAGWYLAYIVYTRTVKPSGMSKELMKLWVGSIVVTSLPVLTGVINTVSFISVYHHTWDILYSILLSPMSIITNFIYLKQFLWFVFSLSMMVTATLTRTKTYIWFALLLALIGIIVRSGVFAYPVTFLLLGGYLEWKRRQITIPEQGSIL